MLTLGPCSSRWICSGALRWLSNVGNKRLKIQMGLRGPLAEMDGLGLFDVTTILKGPKTLTETVLVFVLNNQKVEGYEMHMGISSEQEDR